jgi:hypothetical protein
MPKDSSSAHKGLATNWPPPQTRGAGVLQGIAVSAASQFEDTPFSIGRLATLDQELLQLDSEYKSKVLSWIVMVSFLSSRLVWLKP